MTKFLKTVELGGNWFVVILLFTLLSPILLPAFFFGLIARHVFGADDMPETSRRFTETKK